MTFSVPNNLSEIVMQEISEKIIRNEFKPGERILEIRLRKSWGSAAVLSGKHCGCWKKTGWLS